MPGLDLRKKRRETVPSDAGMPVDPLPSRYTPPEELEASERIMRELMGERADAPPTPEDVLLTELATPKAPDKRGPTGAAPKGSSQVTPETDKGRDAVDSLVKGLFKTDPPIPQGLPNTRATAGDAQGAATTWAEEHGLETDLGGSMPSRVVPIPKGPPPDTLDELAPSGAPLAKLPGAPDGVIDVAGPGRKAPEEPVYETPAERAEDARAPALGGYAQQLKINPEDYRPNLVGPPTPYDPAPLAARAADEYGEDDPGPGHRWEDEFVSRRSPVSDKAIFRAYVGASLFGDKGEGAQVRHQLMQQQQSYDEGLAGARDRDVKEYQQNRRVDRATAQAIATAFGIKPEDAAHIRESSPLVKAFTSGGFAIPSRLHGQDLLAQQAWNREQMAQFMKMMGFAVDLEGLKAKAQTEQQKTAPGEPMTASVHRYVARVASRAGATPVSEEDVGKLLNDQPVEGITPQRAAVIKSLAQEFVSMPKDKQDKALLDMNRMDAQSGSGVERTLETQRGNPAQRADRKTEIQKLYRYTEDATQGWKAMSEEGKRVFLKYAKTGDYTSIFQSAEMPAKDRVPARRLEGLVSYMMFLQTGKAQSNQEAMRFMGQTGMTAHGYNPFVDPNVFRDFLRAAQRSVQDQQGTFIDEFGSWDAPRKR